MEETKYQVPNYGHVKRSFRIHINNIGNQHTCFESMKMEGHLSNIEKTNILRSCGGFIWKQKIN